MGEPSAGATATGAATAATGVATGAAAATAATAGEVTDVLKYFSGTFVETLSEEFTNLNKELKARAHLSEELNARAHLVEEKRTVRVHLVVGGMDEFSSEEMMAFFRATWHFQMWNAIRMQAATDAATPEVTDVRKYFSETFANTVFDEFNNLHKEPTAEDKAAEKKEEQVLKKAEQKFKEAEEDPRDEAPSPKRQATGSSSPKAE